MPPPEWLIDGVLPAGGLCCIYGQPGIGKSFISMDIALSVASGGHWLGHPLQAGYVLYIAAEGGPGIAKRANSWLVARGVTPLQVRIAWMTEPMSIYQGSDNVDRLIGRLDNELQEVPRLIVVDTLARCFDGDENKQQDMGRFVAGIDQLRHEYGATVLIVHHTRLDGDRERGNTAFRGGVDTMIAVKREGQNGIITLECNKQKDAEDFEALRRAVVRGGAAEWWKTAENLRNSRDFTPSGGTGLQGMAWAHCGRRIEPCDLQKACREPKGKGRNH